MVAHLVQWDLLPSAVGDVGVAASAEGVILCSLGVSRDVLQQQLRDLGPGKVLRRGGVQLEQGLRELGQYLQGQRKGFSVPLVPTSGTPFQRQVWASLLTIPWGQTRSYAWVAQDLGRPRAVRAVGQAVGANPIAIMIPCHRVIASDGSLGGFSAGLGCKRQLLAIETTQELSAHPRADAKQLVA